MKRQSCAIVEGSATKKGTLSQEFFLSAITSPERRQGCGQRSAVQCEVDMMDCGVLVQPVVYLVVDLMFPWSS